MSEEEKKEESFFVGLGMDIEHVDNIYRCVTVKDFEFLKERLQFDIKAIEDYIQKNPDDEKNLAIRKLNLAWLNRIKFWRVRVIVEGEY